MTEAADRRDVRHYILTVGRDTHDRPVRELRRLTRGTPALVALQRYDKVADDQLDMLINDLLAERDRRWRKRNGID